LKIQTSGKKTGTGLDKEIKIPFDDSESGRGFIDREMYSKRLELIQIETKESQDSIVYFLDQRTIFPKNKQECIQTTSIEI